MITPQQRQRVAINRYGKLHRDRNQKRRSKNNVVALIAKKEERNRRVLEGKIWEDVEAFKDLRDEFLQYLYITGGRGSGKTQQASRHFIQESFKPYYKGRKFLVARETTASIRKSIFAVFETLIKNTPSLEPFFTIQVGNLSIINKANDVVIDFAGFTSNEGETSQRNQDRIKGLSNYVLILLEESVQFSMETIETLTATVMRDSQPTGGYLLAELDDEIAVLEGWRDSDAVTSEKIRTRIIALGNNFLGLDAYDGDPIARFIGQRHLSDVQSGREVRAKIKQINITDIPEDMRDEQLLAELESDKATKPKPFVDHKWFNAPSPVAQGKILKSAPKINLGYVKDQLPADGQIHASFDPALTGGNDYTSAAFVLGFNDIKLDDKGEPVLDGDGNKMLDAVYSVWGNCDQVPYRQFLPTFCRMLVQAIEQWEIYPTVSFEVNSDPTIKDEFLEAFNRETGDYYPESHIIEFRAIGNKQDKISNCFSAVSPNIEFIDDPEWNNTRFDGLCRGWSIKTKEFDDPPDSLANALIVGRLFREKGVGYWGRESRFLRNVNAW